MQAYNSGFHAVFYFFLILVRLQCAFYMFRMCGKCKKNAEMSFITCERGEEKKLLFQERLETGIFYFKSSAFSLICVRQFDSRSSL